MIISVIVYLSAFSLLIRSMITGRKRAPRKTVKPAEDNKEGGEGV